MVFAIAVLGVITVGWISLILAGMFIVVVSVAHPNRERAAEERRRQWEAH
ncbi:hypothetical protein [Streptomyces sp. AB3(2024)]